MLAEPHIAPGPCLTSREIQRFVRDGFVRLDSAFTRDTAEEAREILWRDTGCNPLNRATWTRPVVRLGSYFDPPFLAAAGTPRLNAAINQLSGAGRWRPLSALGTFPIRFPSGGDPGDTGWHVDASYPPLEGSDESFLSWRVNVQSKGRALLLLFLFSDIGEFDAPTRIRVGSHLDVARILFLAGEGGMSFMELANCLETAPRQPELLATGDAGTVYLCHPFLVHAAQPNHGKEPRFMAQPALEALEPFQLERSDGNYSPNEIAIRLALNFEKVEQWFCDVA